MIKINESMYLSINMGEGIVYYECVRCGVVTNSDELSKLPEIKCICGFRVFKKSRPYIVKSLKAI